MTSLSTSLLLLIDRVPQLSVWGILDLAAALVPLAQPARIPPQHFHQHFHGLMYRARPLFTAVCSELRERIPGTYSYIRSCC